MNVLAQFTRWLDVPLASVTRNEDRGLRGSPLPETTESENNHVSLAGGQIFYEYCINEEGMAMANPVIKIAIRLPKSLPRHLKDDQVANLFAVITKARDRAMFMLMLRSGLRVEEVAHLTVDACRVPEETALCRERQGRQGPHGLFE